MYNEIPNAPAPKAHDAGQDAPMTGRLYLHYDALLQRCCGSVFDDVRVAAYIALRRLSDECGIRVEEVQAMSAKRSCTMNVALEAR